MDVRNMVILIMILLHNRGIAMCKDKKHNVLFRAMMLK